MDHGLVLFTSDRGITPAAAAKKDALEAAGVRVGKTPSETAALAREILGSL